MSFSSRLNIVAMHAWEGWTKNGLNLNDEQREQTAKTANDAAANAYQDGITDLEWLNATIARLR